MFIETFPCQTVWLITAIRSICNKLLFASQIKLRAFEEHLKTPLVIFFFLQTTEIKKKFQTFVLFSSSDSLLLQLAFLKNNLIFKVKQAAKFEILLQG